jgi:hypothetical protein
MPPSAAPIGACENASGHGRELLCDVSRIWSEDRPRTAPDSQAAS